MFSRPSSTPPTTLRRHLVWWPALAVSGLVGCGGDATTLELAHDGGAPDRQDAADAADATSMPDAGGDRSLVADAGPDVPDVTVLPDGVADDSTGDAPADAMDAGEAEDAVVPYDYDGPPVVAHPACSVVWQQPAAFAGSGAGPTSVAVDSAGNVYVAIPYVADVPIDLGGAPISDRVAIAVAKLDPGCHMVWAHALVPPPGTSGNSIIGQTQIAVDPASRVTVLAGFEGALPPDAGDAGDVAGYVETFAARLDVDGGPVFQRAYAPPLYPSLVGAAADGSTLIWVFDQTAWWCREGLASQCDVEREAGVDPDAGLAPFLLVRLDGAGAEVARAGFAGDPAFSGIGSSPATYSDLALDPEGLVWALVQQDAGPAAQRFAPDGSVLWSEPVSATRLTVGPSGGVAWAASSTSPALYQWTTALSVDGAVVYDLFAPVPPIGPYPYYAALDTSGRFYAGGSPSDPAAASGDASVGFTIEVLEPDGAPQGIRGWPSSASTTMQSLAVDPAGNAVVSGTYEVSDGGFGFFVVKLGP